MIIHQLTNPWSNHMPSVSYMDLVVYSPLNSSFWKWDERKKPLLGNNLCTHCNPWATIKQHNRIQKKKKLGKNLRNVIHQRYSRNKIHVADFNWLGHEARFGLAWLYSRNRRNTLARGKQAEPIRLFQYYNRKVEETSLHRVPEVKDTIAYENWISPLRLWFCYRDHDTNLAAILGQVDVKTQHIAQNLPFYLIRTGN